MLTNKQAQCLDIIESYWAEKRSCPSYTEMAQLLGLKSKSSIHRLVTALERRGFIRREAFSARSIEVVRNPEYQRGFAEGLKAGIEWAKAASAADPSSPPP